MRSAPSFPPLCAPPLGGWFFPEPAEVGDDCVSEAVDSWVSPGGRLRVRGRHNLSLLAVGFIVTPAITNKHLIYTPDMVLVLSQSVAAAIFSFFKAEAVFLFTLTEIRGF